MRSWVSGTQLEIRAGGYEATVTSVGATLRRLTLEGSPIVLGFDADSMPSSGHGQLLAPWPNRLRDGRWRWQGEELRLPVDEPQRGNSANHGLVRWAEWHVVRHDQKSVRLSHRLVPRPGYPFALELSAAYSVSSRGLSCALTAVNRGAHPAPVALGAHPYLRPLGGGPIDESELRLPADRRLLVDEYGTPRHEECVESTPFDFRAPRKVDGVVINNAFHGLSHGPRGVVTVSVTDSAGTVSVECGSATRWIQVYTADALAEPDRRRGIAIEPMTAPPGALASGEGLVGLSPGEPLSLNWLISATLGATPASGVTHPRPPHR